MSELHVPPYLPEKMSGCMLEQLTEVATVTNDQGITEELYILHPAKPSVRGELEEQKKLAEAETNKISDDDEKMKDNVDENDVPSSRKRGRPPKRNKDQGDQDGISDETSSEKEVDESITVKSGKSKGQTSDSELPSLNCKDYVGFPCLVCGKVFTLKGNLKVHSRTHTDNKPFGCPFDGCEKSFRSKDMLVKHEMAHNGVKPWECKVCHQGFSSKISMVEHEARHTNTKPYKCKQCGQEFRQYSCLSRHYITHRDEYPFQCSVCSKRFKAKVYLTSHMKVHSEEAPFQCTTCNKRFKHQGDVKRHAVIHTGLKPYSCSLCGIKFTDASARRRHEREHHGQKPAVCQICGDKFKRPGQLKTHLIRKHSGNGELSANDTAVLLGEQPQFVTVGQQGKHLAFVAFPTPTLQPPTTPTKVEKRMITHHVAVPKVNGKAVGVDPAALLDHIKDQLEPSQMPQTVDGQAVQVSCKVLKEDDDQQVVELQYLSTIHVVCSETSEQTQPENKDIIDNKDILDHDTTELIDAHDDGVKGESTNIICNVEIENSDTTKQTNLDGNTFVTLHLEEPKTFDTEVIENNEINITPKISDILSSPLTEHFVKNPNFSNQEYYNWLSTFADACKTLSMPLDTELFEKISNVNKKLADVMANPKGALANKSNFIISMTISKEFAAIIEKHLTYVLNSIS